EFWTKREDCERAGQWIKKTTEVVLGIAPGVSSVPGKQLPPEWYVQTMKPLAGRNIQIVLFGSKDDVTVCEQVANNIASSGGSVHVLNLAGKTSVGEMIECTRLCDLFLSQETAALHIATAMQKPVVGIVGGGHYGRFFPWGAPGLTK